MEMFNLKKRRMWGDMTALFKYLKACRRQGRAFQKAGQQSTVWA